MSLSGHNCNLCKKTTMISRIGAICLDGKFRGKPIKHDDTICEEYEFGGFIELTKGIASIPSTDKL